MEATHESLLCQGKWTLYTRRADLEVLLIHSRRRVHIIKHSVVKACQNNSGLAIREIYFSAPKTGVTQVERTCWY